MQVDAEKSGGEKLRCLFGEGEINERLRRMALLEDVERECFYGECLGFQVGGWVGVLGKGCGRVLREGVGEC